MLGSLAIATLRSGLRARAPSLHAAAGIAAHVLVIAWVFAPALFGGRMPYLRDVSAQFYPNLVFLDRSLAAGVFPLWHPGAEAGSPFLLVYPLDILLVALGGARLALVAGPPLHMLIASVGSAALGRRLGLGTVAAWTSGLVFALSGFMVSAVNLVPLQQAAAWAPVVILAALRCVARPGATSAAVLAVLVAVQVSTLAGEIVLQTAAAAAVLTWRAMDRRALAAAAGAACLAALLAAPPLLGAAALIEGTHRGQGFSAEEALSGSLSPIELAGLVVPGFFGDMHTFTNAGFWGQSVFPGGFPYLLSTYLGLSALSLAGAAGRDRLWLLAAFGIVLALGAHGPFRPLLAGLVLFRAPVKFLFLAALAVALLAGRGLDRALASRAPRAIAAPGAAMMLLAAALLAAPERTASALGLFPPLSDHAAQAVIRAGWPSALLMAGLTSLAAAAAAIHGGRIAAAAALLAVVDLLAAHGEINRFAPAVFYDLRAEVRALLEPAFRGEPARVFGYGIGNTPGLPFAPDVLRENSDVWLYYLDRQVLWARAPVFDGLEGAFEEDRTAWAPPGASLTAAESVPAAFESIHARLRLGNVRWILSFAALPAHLVTERGAVLLPEVLVPLRLFELRDPLPRAFFVPDLARPLEAVQAPPPVAARTEGPHDVHLHARTPPGYVVLLSGGNPGWRARGDDGAPVEMRRAGPRYIALPTPGGERRFFLEYRPRWWPRSLALLALGAIAALLALAKGARQARGNAGAATPPDPA